MRIIIEDTQSALQALLPSQVDPSSLSDGGPAPGQLHPGLAGGSTGLPAGQVGELQDGGPPPAWLVEAVGKAFQGDPGRFDTGSPSQGEGEVGLDPSDGGRAPDLSGE